jgi:hypothetical protein
MQDWMFFDVIYVYLDILIENHFIGPSDLEDDGSRCVDLAAMAGRLNLVQDCRRIPREILRLCTAQFY